MYLFHEPFVGDFIEERYNIQVYYVFISATFCPPDCTYGLMRRVSCPKTKAIIVKILFKDRLNDLTNCLLTYAIPDRGNA
ncbi:hypothetical protein D3C81_2055860 [compost metagenome]